MEIKRISNQDCVVLRGLAKKLSEEAHKPQQEEHKKQWYLHNDLQSERPLIFCDPENGWHEIVPESTLQCISPMAREWEFLLRKRLFTATTMLDDAVTDDVFSVGYVADTDGWGVEIQHIGGKDNGAYKVKQAIEDYEEDFSKLHFPNYTVDYKASEQLMEEANHVFDGILRLEQYGWWWWSLGLTAQYIDLRGLESFMYDMYDEPEWVHRLMELLCKGTLDKLDRLEKEGLLGQNIGNHYVGSGGFGFTNDIAPVTPGMVRTMDMWGFVESQETVSVSPEMYAEFVFPYHKRIAERFALNCFGCCEPYDARWQYAKKLPRLRRVSCSPWSNRAKTFENLGKNYIASLKLNPSPLSRPDMDEAFVRQQLQEALEGAKGCSTELIMKDCHTIGHNPMNPVRWVQIAREEIDRIFGA